jgi:3-oxoacyl-[acyl-carrier protein] reductase
MEPTTRGCAVVTGGSGAIGSAVCRALARQGMDIAFTYRSNEEAGRRLEEELHALGRAALGRRVDVTDEAAVTSLVEEAVARFGGVHTVVTSAAPLASQLWTSRITPTRLTDQLTEELAGVHNLVSAALPHLREARGSIVAVTTVANRRFVLRDVLSSAPKAAVEALMRAIAAEEGRHGVRANAVGVGILSEGMAATLIASGEVRESDMEHALTRVPLRRLGVADDIAGAVAFLAGPTASYVTGQWIDVDGGYAL